MPHDRRTRVTAVSSPHRDRRNALRLLRSTRLLSQHDATRQANGLLKTTSKGIATSAAHVETQSYDFFGRPSKTQTTLAEIGPSSGTTTYTARVEYDENGRPYRQDRRAQ